MASHKKSSVLVIWFFGIVISVEEQQPLPLLRILK